MSSPLTTPLRKGGAQLLGAATLCLLAGIACSEDAGRQSDGTKARPTPPKTSRSSEFSQERAWKHLEAQWRMGPRAPGLPGHLKVRAYLESELKSHGAQLTVDTFPHRLTGEDKDRELSNISGLFGDPAKGLLLIGTHYDTRLWADADDDRANHGTPIHGSNDGGSGTAVLLEMARVLGDNPPPFGVELVFFDGEEVGRHGRIQDYFIGSKRMAENWEAQRDIPLPDTVVVIDMVGDIDFAIGPDRESQARFPELNERIWKAAAKLGATGFVPKLQGPVLDDHVAFMKREIRSTLLIDFKYPYWHTVEDTIDKCSADSLGQVGRVLLEALVDEPERMADGFPK